jgi:hypothetical protein
VDKQPKGRQRSLSVAKQGRHGKGPHILGSAKYLETGQLAAEPGTEIGIVVSFSA